MSDANAAQLNVAALAEIASVKGQLTQITQMLALNHSSTNMRIDDMRRSIESQLGGLDKRLSEVEKNERGTAIRTSAIGAASAALVSAAFEVIRHLRP